MQSIGTETRHLLAGTLHRRELHSVGIVALCMLGLPLVNAVMELPSFAALYTEIVLRVGSFVVLVLCVAVSTRGSGVPASTRPSRTVFLLGRLGAVAVLAPVGYALFAMVLFFGHAAGAGSPSTPHLLPYFYLQGLRVLLVSALALWWSRFLPRHVTMAAVILFAVLSGLITNVLIQIGSAENPLLLAVNYLVPQLSLFDLTTKVVYAHSWPPLETPILLGLTLYAMLFVLAYGVLAFFCFRAGEAT